MKCGCYVVLVKNRRDLETDLCLTLPNRSWRSLRKNAEEQCKNLQEGQPGVWQSFLLPFVARCLKTDVREVERILEILTARTLRQADLGRCRKEVESGIQDRLFLARSTKLCFANLCSWAAPFFPLSFPHSGEESGTTSSTRSRAQAPHRQIYILQCSPLSHTAHEISRIDGLSSISLGLSMSLRSRTAEDSCITLRNEMLGLEAPINVALGSHWRSDKTERNYTQCDCICMYPGIILFTRMSLNTFLYIHTYIHTSIHPCMHACILRTYVHTYIHTCIYIYIHPYIHPCIHTYIHRYIDT